MQDGSPFNPYAPPRAAADTGWRPARGPSQPAAGFEEALRRLAEHVSDPRNLASDRRTMGSRVRVVGPVLLGSGLFAIAGAALLWALDFGPKDDTLPILLAPFGGLFALLGILVLVIDLTLASREKPMTPERTLKSFLRATAMGRYGYVWATLCPTAREQNVSTPDLTPVKTAPGEFSLQGEAGVKAYLTSFARASGSMMRVVAAKRIVSAGGVGDMARVGATLTFQSWPRWVSIAAAVGFIVFRPLVIIGVVAFFVLRKRRVVQVTKALLRAPNGVWYVHDADLLEGAEPQVSSGALE